MDQNLASSNDPLGDFISSQNINAAPSTDANGKLNSFNPQAQRAIGTAAAGNMFQQAGQDISGAFQGGINQVKQGYQQVANSGGNPLTATEGALSMGAGVVNAATSPLAPVTAPLGQAAGAVGNAIGNNP